VRTTKATSSGAGRAILPVVHRVDALSTLGRTIGFSFAAGLNLYATVAILGLASRYHWVDLPEQYRVYDNNWIIGAALVLYIVEFVADKIPWVDSVWDVIHTVIRPAGGALIAVTTIGHAQPGIQAAAALAGAALASSSHLAKAGTRVAANTSPEPFSNWILSLSEDGFVVVLGLLALEYPRTAALVVLGCVAVIVGSARWLIRRIRRRRRHA
jgi:uncharacterized protein DUF4126